MAAGQGFKTFTTGEVLTAADVNGYLMQGVLVFASAAARDAAITSPQEGQFAYTKDNNSLWYYTGSAWAASGATGDIEGVTAGVGISGGGTSGTVTITNSMATEISAKGDLIAGTGSQTFDNLTVGTNGQVLTADSTAATGLAWASPTTLISTTSLSGASTTISFGTGYKNLLFVFTEMLNNTSDGICSAYFNSGTTNQSGVYTTGTTSTSYNDTTIRLSANQTLNRANAVNCIGLSVVNYNNYYQAFQVFGGWYQGARVNVNGGGQVHLGAVTSLTVYNGGGTWAGGTVSLYGSK